MNQTERLIRMEQARIEKDRQMIADPTTWPMWPRLPLKRRVFSRHPNSLGRDFGFLTAPAAEPYIVHMENRETVVYSDLDQLLAEWRID